MVWKKTVIQLNDGTFVEAQAPEIISASRSTDLPAFYSDWFFERLKIGYSVWTNPFNGKSNYISYQNTRFIVFWSKNPQKLIPHLNELKQHTPIINTYVQYTLNDYVDEGLEKGVPSLEERLETFRQLVAELGSGQVVWRFDPLILTDHITPQKLLDKIEKIGDKLYGYTEKLVFSFADIKGYKKVERNLKKDGIHYQEWDEPLMMEFARNLCDMNLQKGWNYQLATCAEAPIFQKFGIKPNRCIDDELITRIAWRDSELMKLLGVEIRQKGMQKTLFDKDDLLPPDALLLDDNQHYAVWQKRKKGRKDKGQRPLCNCVPSKDIGRYNTCPHLCEYCYANESKESALENFRKGGHL